MKKTKDYPEVGTVVYQARRQKNIRLSLRNNQILVTYPYLASFSAAEAFLLQKKDWVLKNHRRAPTLKNKQLIGRSHRLCLQKNLPKPYIENQVIYGDPQDLTSLEPLIKGVLKKEATRFILPRVTELSQALKLKPRRISFRYMKTRWGSCSSRSSVNLNTALVYLPQDLVDYVIIHELCHLRHLNHSANFWRLVQSFLPEYKLLRTVLKEYPIYFVIEKPKKDGAALIVN